MCSHLISLISMANDDLPSMGESAENVRSMKASMYGIVALWQGAYKPQAASRETAHKLRITVDLPAMLGPAWKRLVLKSHSRQVTVYSLQAGLWSKRWSISASEEDAASSIGMI